jgi:hypothetical protein
MLMQGGKIVFSSSSGSCAFIFSNIDESLCGSSLNDCLALFIEISLEVKEFWYDLNSSCLE